MLRNKAVPVWHLHESIHRLVELCREWPRVCFGSSGEYATIRTDRWHRRMQDAFETIYCKFNFQTQIHGLRMLDGRVLGNYPLATADSTNLACNVPKFNTKYPELTRAIREAEFSRGLSEKELTATILKIVAPFSKVLLKRSSLNLSLNGKRKDYSLSSLSWGSHE